MSLCGPDKYWVPPSGSCYYYSGFCILIIEVVNSGYGNKLKDARFLDKN